VKAASVPAEAIAAARVKARLAVERAVEERDPGPLATIIATARLVEAAEGPEVRPLVAAARRAARAAARA